MTRNPVINSACISINALDENDPASVGEHSVPVMAAIGSTTHNRPHEADQEHQQQRELHDERDDPHDEDPEPKRVE